MIIGFPLTFCYLYYAYNDNSCVSEPVYKLAINLGNYLLISSLISISILIIVCLVFYSLNLDSINKTNNTCFFCCLMDTTNCNEEVYNYAFASFIIKLSFNAIGLFQRKNDKKK
jgi:hypothetical protein